MLCSCLPAASPEEVALLYGGDPSAEDAAEDARSDCDSECDLADIGVADGLTSLAG